MLSYTNPTTGQCGCECGQLPYTVTLEYQNVPPQGRAGFPFITFTSCFGSGASARVAEPGGANPESDAGPIARVELLNPGACYAVLGREAPQFTIYGYGIASGAQFEATLAEVPDECGRPRWAIASVSVTGGADYGDNVVLDVLPSPGSITVVKAVLRVRSTDGVPTSVDVEEGGLYYRENRSLPPIVAPVTAVPGGGGTGAQLVVTVDDDVDSKTFGQIASLTIANGGDGYFAWQPYDWPCGVNQGNRPIVLTATNPKILARACATASFGIPPILAIDSSGYDGTPSPIKGITLMSFGSGMARKGRVAPTLTTTTTTGSGATFAVTLEQSQDADGFDQWAITSIKADQKGSGYTDNGILGINWSSGVRLEPTSARVWTREMPTVSVEAKLPADFEGEAAALTATLARNPGYPPTWSIANVSIDSPGSKYPSLVEMSIEVTSPGIQVKPAALLGYTNTDGEIRTVAVEYGGEFYRPGTKAMEVQLLAGGLYYREDNAAAPYVATVAAGIEQIPPSAGSGAVITLAIDTNPTSPTFGQATAATLSSPGDNYTLFGGPRRCGTSVGAYRTTCGGGTTLRFGVLQSQTPGPNRGVRATISGASTETTSTAVAVFESTQPVRDCGQLPKTLDAVLGEGRIKITPGGRSPPTGYGYCCEGCAILPGTRDDIESITVQMSGSARTNSGQACGSGTVTLVLNAANNWTASATADDGNPLSPALFGADLEYINSSFALYLGASWGFDCQAHEFGSSVSAPVFQSLQYMPTIELDGKCLPRGFQWRARPGEDIAVGFGDRVQYSASVTVALK